MLWMFRLTIDLPEKERHEEFEAIVNTYLLERSKIHRWTSKEIEIVGYIECADPLELSATIITEISQKLHINRKSTFTFEPCAVRYTRGKDENLFKTEYLPIQFRCLKTCFEQVTILGGIDQELIKDKDGFKIHLHLRTQEEYDKLMDQFEASRNATFTFLKRFESLDD